MRRKEREMDREFALSVLDKCTYLVLAMTDGGGEPYCVPLNPVREGDVLYFHCAPAGEKTDCLRAHPRVCLTAVGDTRVVQEQYTTEYESVIARGTAEEVTGDAEKRSALWLLCRKFTPDCLEGLDRVIDGSLARTGIWRIRLGAVTGKRKKCRPDGRELTAAEAAELE